MLQNVAVSINLHCRCRWLIWKVDFLADWLVINEPRPKLKFSFGDFLSVDLDDFGIHLCMSDVYTDPVDDVDTFSGQLQLSVTVVLDRLAQLRSWTKHCGRCNSRWLSNTAVADNLNSVGSERAPSCMSCCQHWDQCVQECLRQSLNRGCWISESDLACVKRTAPHWWSFPNVKHTGYTRIMQTSNQFFKQKLEKIAYTVSTRLSSAPLFHFQPPAKRDASSLGELTEVMAVIPCRTLDWDGVAEGR